jgi:uncharacterized lipoprotein NlpE involved in copper resistance
MKTKMYILSIFILSLSCKNAEEPKSDADVGTTPVKETLKVDNAHTSINSLNYSGTYQGIIPCAHCEGIKTSITLNTDGTYSRTIQYLGKEDSSSTENGKYTWNDEGSEISISIGETETQAYKVGENKLFHLDREGNVIKGDLADNYILQKQIQNHANLVDKKWILIELQGKKIETTNSPVAYILFDSELSQVSGNNSCNNYSGNYGLEDNGGILLGELSITERFCADRKIREREVAFNDMLNKIDNYTIENGILSLNKAKMAPLAKFELE